MHLPPPFPHPRARPFTTGLVFWLAVGGGVTGATAFGIVSPPRSSTAVLSRTSNVRGANGNGGGGGGCGAYGERSRRGVVVSKRRLAAATMAEADASKIIDGERDGVEVHVSGVLLCSLGTTDKWCQGTAVVGIVL